MAWEAIPLFPEPEPVRVRLSKMYAHCVKRRGTQIRWSTFKTRATCDECFAVQHEDRGTGWPRNTAITRRTSGEHVLLLCGMHAELWKEKDA